MQGRVSLLVLAVTAMLAFAAPARAETFTVTGQTDSPEMCSGTSCPSIRSAIIQASISPGVDTVSIPAGDYQLNSALQINNDVNVQGAGIDQTTVHGGGSYRVFEVQAGIATSISQLTMRDGSGVGANNHFGGNLVNYGGAVRLDHVRVTAGRANSGGGIANRSGTMTVQNSVIDSNTAPADVGAGGDAGAILNFGGDGAPATLLVRTSTIAFNTARLAGAILEYGNDADSTRLEHVTVAYNQTGDRGGPALSGAQPIHFRSSLVANNFTQTIAPNCSANVVSEGGNAESGTDCGFELQSGNLRISDGFDAYTLPLGTGSEAIDRGGDCTGTDQRGVARPQGAACDPGAYEVESAMRIDSAPADPTNRRDVSFTFSPVTTATVTYECRLDAASDEQTYSPCTSPMDYQGLSDGPYRFLVRAVDAQGEPVGAAAARSFRIDATAPDAPVILSSEGGELSGTAEPFAAIEILADDVVVGTTVAGSDGRWSYPIPGDARRTYTVRASDAAGNVSPPSAPLTVGAVPAQQTPTPTPTPAPVATPVPQQSVAGRPTGTVLVRVPGGKFVPLDPSKAIPLGSTIDAKKGSVAISAILKKGGKVERATFSEGIFRVTQTRTTTDLTLTEALAKCPRAGKASATAAAKKKPKSRKLWGDGSGSFRTRGQYSAATVRGTKWLVQDSCAGTLTRVAKGVVQVQDFVKRKTLLLRAPKTYTARKR